MIYIKSTLAGVMTVVLAALSLVIAILLYNGTSDFVIGWDTRGLRSVSFWITVGLLFAIGYAWQYRRLSKRTSG